MLDRRGGAMRCPVCGHGNSERARFCSQCGTGLERACPACASPYEPGARFCDQCGTALPDGVTVPGDREPAVDDLSRYVPEELLRKIRAARAGQAMQGERRTVTMLFADLQGSTAAAEHLDPEDWAEIINGAFGYLIAPVYRYEGTLARLQGDAILAFFGAPIAHEDDPVRAVRAGLEVQAGIRPYLDEVERVHGIPIAVRVGINTGLVVVGEVGSDLRVEYTALGDAINVAARMEQTADPGSVRVTEETRRLLGGAFTTEVIGEVEVRGKQAPVLAHRVLAVAPEDTDAAPTDAPLVGREAEFGRLVDAVDRVVAGVGGVCTVVGEAGIGKSRLLAAMRLAADDRHGVADRVDGDGGVSWLQGHARAYEHTVPHATVAGMLARWWGGVTVADGFEVAAAAVDRVAGAPDPDAPVFLAAMVGAALPEAAVALLDTLPVPIRHARTTEAVVAHLRAEAARRPTVVVLDDLHWADAVSLGLVQELMALTEVAPLLLVAVMRPNRDDPAWELVEAAARDHGHRHTRLELQSLPGSAVEELLDRLLGADDLDRATRAEVLERSNGNPLFVEEIVRSLADGGGATGPGRRLAVPPSLTGLLTSRLDRLDEGARHVAQVMSVIGREFDLGTLQALVDDATDLPAHLGELLRRGVLEERRQIPQAVYAFRHPLIRETAYSTVLVRTRRELHARVARHLLEHAPDAAPEIAHHLVEAGDPAAAFPHLVEAGQRSLRAMALSDAIRSLTEALGSVPATADPDLVRAAHEALGEAHALVPDLSRAAATYQSLLDYGRRCGRPTLAVAALNHLGFSSAAIAGDYDGARGYLDEARRLAEDIGDDLGLADYHMNSCFVASRVGDLEMALRHDRETARIGARVGSSVIHLTGLLRATANLMAVFHFDEALASCERALALAEEFGNQEAIALLHTDCLATLALRDGDLAGARDLLREHLPTIDRFASLYGALVHHRAAQVALLVGDVEGALAEYAATARAGEGHGQDFAVAAGQVGGAATRLLVGMPEELDDVLDDARRLLATPAGEFMATGLWASVGEAELHRHAAPAAQQAFVAAASASSVEHMWELPRARLGAARAALALGDLAQVRAQLDEVRAYIAEHRLRLHEPELFTLDGRLALREGRPDAAATLLHEAVTAATETGAVLRRVEALAGLADVRAVQGRTDEAEALRERAGAVVREVSSAIVDEELRAAFLRTSIASLRPVAGATE